MKDVNDCKAFGGAWQVFLGWGDKNYQKKSAMFIINQTQNGTKERPKT